jgi:hypothetical protein
LLPKAVEYLVKNPNLTVREGMTLTDFLRQKWDVMDAEEAITSLEGELRAEVTESTEGETGAV